MAKRWPGEEVARRRRRGAGSVEPEGMDSGSGSGAATEELKRPFGELGVQEAGEQPARAQVQGQAE